MAKISVLLPLYNNWLESCISMLSIVRQSFQDFEVIVIDDASTDGTAARLDEWQDPRIRRIRLEKHSGTAAALNAGLAAASGEYVARVTPGSVSLPGRFQAQLDRLAAHPKAGAVLGPAADGEMPDRDALLRNLFFRMQAPALETALIRRSAFAAVGGWDERLTRQFDIEWLIRFVSMHDLAWDTAGVLSSEAPAATDLPAQLLDDWERRKTLESFQRLTGSDVMRIFPEVRRYGRDLGDQDVPYVLARMASDSDDPVLHWFGLDLLHALLEPALGLDLPGRFHFTHSELIALSGQTRPATTRNQWLMAPYAVKELELGVLRHIEQLTWLDAARQELHNKK